MHPYYPSYQMASPNTNFLILLLALIINYGAVWFWWDTPIIVLYPILIVSILLLGYARSWKLLFTYIIFAFVGAGQEAFFATIGLWHYQNATFLSIPIYLPFIWGNIAILAVGLFQGIRGLNQKRGFYHHPPSFLRVLLATTSAIPLLIFMGYFFSDSPTLLTLLLIGFDIGYVIFLRSVPLALVGIVTFLCGSLSDLVALQSGIWNYPSGGLFSNIPSYVFIGWDIVGLIAVGIYLIFDTWEDDQKTHSFFPPHP